MFYSPRHKEVHLHLDPATMTYPVQAEYDVASAETEEERLKVTFFPR